MVWGEVQCSYYAYGAINTSFSAVPTDATFTFFAAIKVPLDFNTALYTAPSPALLLQVSLSAQCHVIPLIINLHTTSFEE